MWMVVVSLGILGSTGLEEESIAYVIFVAFAVNMTWGAIDGISVMMTKVIDRAKIEKVVYELRTKNDGPSRDAAFKALDETVVASLSDEDRRRVIEMVAAGDSGRNPALKPYYADREEWYYAIGIFFIDTTMVIPLVIPLLLIDDPVVAIYTSQLIATTLFALLGVAYAWNLHRSKVVAALWLGTMCFSVFTMVFIYGW